VIYHPPAQVRVLSKPKSKPKFGPHTIHSRDDLLAIRGTQCLALALSRVTATTTPEGIVLTLITTDEDIGLLRGLARKMVDDHNRFHFIRRDEHAASPNPMSYVPSTAAAAASTQGATILLKALVSTDAPKLRGSILRDYLTGEPPVSCAADGDIKAQAEPDR
jgi:hypothetical protein